MQAKWQDFQAKGYDLPHAFGEPYRQLDAIAGLEAKSAADQREERIKYLCSLFCIYSHAGQCGSGSAAWIARPPDRLGLAIFRL